MKIFLILFILATLFTNSKAQDEMEKINSIIQQLKEKFAPDKGTAVFNFEAVESENKIIIKGETNINEAYSEFTKMMSDADIKFDNQIEMIKKKKL